MDLLYDMHCHVDFAEEAKGIVAQSAQANIKALSCTVTPSSFVSDIDQFAGFENITFALGLHPWWVADRRASEVDIAHFISLLPEAPFVGEIGLDLSGVRKETKDDQIRVLTRLLQAIQEAGDGRVITFHGVRSASMLLDILESMQVAKGNRCLLHWFQGSPEEFGRAVSMGMSFSVGMRMLATPKGTLFAAGIPDEQLLLETDEPAHEGSVWSIGAWREELENTLVSLASLRECSPQHLGEVLTRNSESLLLYPFA